VGGQFGGFASKGVGGVGGTEGVGLEVGRKVGGVGALGFGVGFTKGVGGGVGV